MLYCTSETGTHFLVEFWSGSGIISSQLRYSWITSALPCHIEVSNSVVAIVPERPDGVVHSEVRQFSLTKQGLDDLLRLSKKSSPVEAWPKARFRVILVLCLPSHLNNLLNELQTDHATELWNIIHKLSMLICHESQLRHQCELKLCCILSCNTSCNVCVVERESVRNVLRVERTVDVKDQHFQLSQTMN